MENNSSRKTTRIKEQTAKGTHDLLEEFLRKIENETKLQGGGEK